MMLYTAFGVVPLLSLRVVRAPSSSSRLPKRVDYEGELAIVICKKSQGRASRQSQRLYTRLHLF